MSMANDWELRELQYTGHDNGLNLLIDILYLLEAFEEAVYVVTYLPGL